MGNQRLVLLLFLTSRVLRNPSREFLNGYNLKVAQKPFQALVHIIAKPKDPVTKEQQADAIYSNPCNDCDHEYTIQTKGQFGTLLKEHKKAAFVCKKENSALSEHTCLTNHTIGWDKSKIISTVNLVSLRFKANTTSGSLFTHSVDLFSSLKFIS